MFERRRLVIENKSNNWGSWEPVGLKYIVNAVEQDLKNEKSDLQATRKIAKMLRGETISTRNFEYRRAR